jgi:hypothetical protein
MSSVGYYNRFMGHSATPLRTALTQLAEDRILQITPYDPPYYFLRSAALPEGDRIHDFNMDENPYSDISAAGWLSVSVTHEMIDIHPEIEQELLFLCYLGLSMHLPDSDEYVVSPDADRLLYGERGIFRADAPPESLTEFTKYLKDVIGPGYYWRAHYLTRSFPEDIYDTQEAQWVMGEVADLVGALNMYGDK